MNDLNDTETWRDMSEHLVQAHGGDADALISYAPTLEQLRVAHADTHVALAMYRRAAAGTATLTPCRWMLGGTKSGSRRTAHSSLQLLRGMIRSPGAFRCPTRPAYLTRTFLPPPRTTWPTGRPCGRSQTYQPTGSRAGQPSRRPDG